MDRLLRETREKMKRSVANTEKEFSRIRTGRASVSLLDHITVAYYGSDMPLSQVATLSVPEARLIVIQPWDKTLLPTIEKAIFASDLGLTPNSDGNVIRLEVPALTEDRRKELTRVVQGKAEEGRVAIRNIRRDANDTIGKMEKRSDISEDEAEAGKKEVQKITDEFVAEIDKVTEKKVNEIMEV